MRIAIVDGFFGGHHGEFLARIVRLALSDWESVEVFGAPCEETSREFAMLADRVTFIDYRWPDVSQLSRVRRVGVVAREWIRLGRLARDRGASAVFLAYADFLLDHMIPSSFVNRALGLPWTGLWFHPMYPRIPRLAARLDFRIMPTERLLRSKWCVGIGLLDEGIVEPLARALPGKRVVSFPDRPNDSAPVILDRVAADIRARATGRRICVLAGSLTSRKGIGTLLRAAAGLGQEWYFVLVGRLFPGALAEADRTVVAEAGSGAIENVYPGFDAIPTEAHFNGWIALADVVFAAYEGFPHSSNLLGKAALFAKPVIVSDGFLMAERVRRFDLGWVVAERSPSEVASALREVENLDAGRFADGCRRYLEAHSPGAERKAWHDLTLAIRLPPQSAREG